MEENKVIKLTDYKDSQGKLSDEELREYIDGIIENMQGEDIVSFSIVVETKKTYYANSKGVDKCKMLGMLEFIKDKILNE